MRKFVPVLAVMIVALGSHSFANNWAHWRGPTGNGTALDAAPPIEWSLNKNVKWKIELPGRGSSSPVIWDNIPPPEDGVPVPCSHGRAQLPEAMDVLLQGQRVVLCKK